MESIESVSDVSLFKLPTETEHWTLVAQPKDRAASVAILEREAENKCTGYTMRRRLDFFGAIYIYIIYM